MIGRPHLVASRAQVLVATTQTEFNIAAQPTRHGRVRKTRDMAEITACICGQPVEQSERVVNSATAVQCGYRGCETSWVCLAACCVLLSMSYSNLPPFFSSILNVSITIVHLIIGAARITRSVFVAISMSKRNNNSYVILPKIVVISHGWVGGSTGGS